ncbi:DUF7287 family protein [Natronobeatus ordinarius]|uniref:DUF7287 family protein n=1 Tax=Natronobeatus ordinarius TaxID=2963433 RepID=UPI0020CC3489|nr:hypothetical protein [Natronobeatus ordinarius]
MTRKRTPTVSISLSDRGQTTQDFAVGIGLFLLAIAFVFTYVPTLITPFSTPVGGAETAQADRIAATIVDDLSVDTDGANELNLTAFDERYESEEDRIENLGLRSTTTADGDPIAIDRVNVTIYSLNESTGGNDLPVTAGDDYDEGQATSSASRIVTIDPAEGDDYECNPACRLSVRVW